MRSPYWARISLPLIITALMPLIVSAILLWRQQSPVESAELLLLGGAAAAAIVASFISWRRSVSAFGAMDGAIHAINDGDAEARLVAAKHLGALTGSLSEGLERIAEESVSSARIRNAIDCAGGLVMIADENMDIVYLNKGLNAMFTRAQDDLAKVLPGFRADKLLGSSMDIFHKAPEAQRRNIARLTSTHNATIELNGWFFALAVSPVVTADGRRTGTVVEWRDLTDEVRVQKEVDAVIAAASRGEFSQRVNPTGAPYQLVEISNKLNTLLETVDVGLGETMRVAKALADGDLTQRHTGEFEGQFELLQSCVNATAETLGTLIAQIRGSSIEIEATSSVLSRGSSDLSERAESQAASLQETAATMEEMSATIKANADGAVRATGLASKATGLADESGAVVSEAVSAIGRIEESASKIRAIVDVIDGIAFQTNLLALNAAVEAARAGEAGKGFAVVASEVRQLAQRSADAARDVNGLIGESGANVESGVKAVHATGQTLEQIQATIRDISETIADISMASQEQANAVEEVSSTVNQLDQITQRNASAASESANSAGGLLRQAQELSELVLAFQIPVAQAQRDAA